MLHKILLIILSGVILASCGIILQESGVKNYSPIEKISPKGLNKYQHDFLYLTKLIEECFPRLDSIFPEEIRELQTQKILSALSTVENNADFILHARKYLSHLKNQHTNIYLNQDFQNVYPFVIYISSDEWYLLNLSQQYDSLHIGKKIIEINELDIGDIECRLIKYTFSENKISQQFEVCDLQLYNKPQYLKQIGVIKENSESLKLKFDDYSEVEIALVPADRKLEVYDISIEENPVTKHQNETYLFDLYKDENFGYLQFNRCHDKIDILEGIESYVKPWIQPIAKRYVTRQFKKDNPSKRIAELYNPKYPVFKEFVWQLIDSLNNSKTENLIIDLRNNPGGNLTLGIQLLYFLTKRDTLNGFKEYAYTSDVYKHYFPDETRALELQFPEGIPQNKLILSDHGLNVFTEITDQSSNYFIAESRPIFDGNIYVLSSHRTGSAAAMLTTLFQDNGIGTVIGTSVGNNPIGPTTYTPMELPKTKAKISIATTYTVRPRAERGAIQTPDIWVEYTISDLLDAVDPYLEMVKKEIAAKANRQ